jgi:hypothetical protein
MLVGLVAGILAFGVARLFGEPQVDRAIAFEDQLRTARGEASEPVLVSRQTQAGIGLFTGVVVYAAALGGLFALVFAAAYGRVAALGPRATAVLLALAGFIVVVAVLALKYPPNPPAVGDPATIGRRTALYFTMIAISLAAAVAAAGWGRRLAARFGAAKAVVTALAGFALAIALVQHLLPAVHEVPQHFSAAVLWRFRLAAIAVQAVIWASLGLGFGVAADRALRTNGPRLFGGRPALR